jgi:heterotetrameric sarcosine oxidase gamma subunit
VADFKLVPRPAIALVAQTGRPAARDSAAAVTITTGIGYALATVMARKDRTELLVTHVRDAFGLDLPATPRRITAGAVAFAWAGPECWLAMTEGSDGPAFEAKLRAALRDLAAVNDQSDGRVVIRVGENGARGTLAKGLPIDLHPGAFRPGDTAMTVVSHVPTQIWQIDAAPTYELAVPRSLAASFFHWLAGAAGLEPD